MARAIFVASVFFATAVIPRVASAQSPGMDCTIQPFRTVDLASPVPGVVATVEVAVSDFVDAGAVAATLESGVERATVELADARAAINSEVKANSVNLTFDQRRKERMQALYAKKSVSIDLRDEAAREQELSRWRLQQAKDVKAVRALELARAQEQLKQKTIRTPISGFVVKQFKDPGEYVEDQPILRIAQLNPLTVELRVPVAQRGDYRLGMRADVFPDDANERAYAAEITAIDRVADAAKGTVGLHLTLPNPDYDVLAGVRCTARFGTNAAAMSR